MCAKVHLPLPSHPPTPPFCHRPCLSVRRTHYTQSRTHNLLSLDSHCVFPLMYPSLLLRPPAPKLLFSLSVAREKPKSVQCTGCSHSAPLFYLSGGCLHGTLCFFVGWPGYTSVMSACFNGSMQVFLKQKTKRDPRIIHIRFSNEWWRLKDWCSRKKGRSVETFAFALLSSSFMPHIGTLRHSRSSFWFNAVASETIMKPASLESLTATH